MRSALALLAALFALGCTPHEAARNAFAPRPYVELKHPGWARNAVIYELNTRQFTPEGTFNAAQAQLPRLHELGVDIIWLMPIHEIGVKNRKGTLGSPYSVKDYYSVNHEFGTLDDLKSFVAEAHRQGMHVILDWVGNHTAWDNPLVEQHPDWYERDWKGDFMPTPWFDWSDIIDLDYDQPGLRRYMTEALVYWVREADIDGYRADTAGFVPLDFWENARSELEKIKPVFMLAEWDQRDVHARAFDATYSWPWGNAMRDAAASGNVGALVGYYSGNESGWPADAYRMVFTSNHDWNSWEGTEFEKFGPAVDAAIALSFVGEGMPMIYSGQEAGNHKRLAFFERDPIAWRADAHSELLRRLIALKHATPALWNGADGARMIPVVNSAPQSVLSFVRFKDGAGVFAVFNLSAEARSISFEQSLHYGDYTDYLSGEQTGFGQGATLAMPAWSFRLFVKRAGP